MPRRRPGAGATGPETKATKAIGPVIDTATAANAVASPMPSHRTAVTGTPRPAASSSPTAIACRGRGEERSSGRSAISAAPVSPIRCQEEAPREPVSQIAASAAWYTLIRDSR
ncbi:hypothetical protein A5N15_09400 [Rothia kristinae]|uniref:Uncharacterized protein n=1 Tax=Rothia kristinae TaxID=37923 RepID=A0A657ITZ3_9MICC|nr:hypothetical protein A5N15_09400 [Rothia kristinae]